jgi:hypothetical protein
MIIKPSATKIFCWNCEEEVHSEAFQCPYCEVNLGGGNSHQNGEALPPPYQPESNQERVMAQHHSGGIPTPSYQDTQVNYVKQQDRQTQMQQQNQQGQKKKGGQAFKRVVPFKTESHPAGFSNGLAQPVPTTQNGQSEAQPAAGNVVVQKGDGIESAFKTLMLLLAGMVFFMFGFILFLYSGQPYFTLRWETSNWIYFLPPSLPMLYYGWKSVQDME